MAKNLSASVGDGLIWYVYSVIYIVMCILGVVSNVLLLVAFLKDPLKCFRNSGTYLVINLSVSDCLTSLLTLVYHSVRRFSSHGLTDFFINWMTCVSFVSIASISIDRFWMVSYPIRHRILMKSKIVVLWIAAIWIVNILISFSLTISDVSYTNERRGVCAYSLILIILSSVMYSSTYYKLKNQSRNMTLQNSAEGRAQEMRILKEKRFLKTIIIIACIAFICIVPFSFLFFLYYSLSFIANDVQALIIFFAASAVIYQINFAVNPLIYILRLPNYRKTFYLLYCKRKTRSHLRNAMYKQDGSF